MILLTAKRIPISNTWWLRYRETEYIEDTKILVCKYFTLRTTLVGIEGTIYWDAYHLHSVHYQTLPLLSTDLMTIFKVHSVDFILSNKKKLRVKKPAIKMKSGQTINQFCYRLCNNPPKRDMTWIHVYVSIIELVIK